MRTEEISERRPCSETAKNGGQVSVLAAASAAAEPCLPTHCLATRTLKMIYVT